MPNHWYVITGGPSSGKTTLVEELARRGYHTVPEAARVIIDEAVAKGTSVAELRADEQRFQEDVARLKQKLEATLQPNTPTFFDRGMHDTLAYMRFYDFPVDRWLEALMAQASYHTVFLLEPLPHYEKDYARTEDETFAEHLRTLLHDTYNEYGMQPIDIEAVSVEERLQLILNHITTEGNA